MKAIKILTTINKSKYGLGLGVMHSVFVTDKHSVISFEGKYPLAKRRVKVIPLGEYLDRVHKTISTIEITPIEIDKYLGIQGHMLCHEFVANIYNLETGKNPFSNMGYVNLSHNMIIAVKRFWLFMVYILFTPFIVWFIASKVYTPNTVEQCINTILPNNKIEIEYE